MILTMMNCRHDMLNSRFKEYFRVKSYMLLFVNAFNYENTDMNIYIYIFFNTQYLVFIKKTKREANENTSKNIIFFKLIFFFWLKNFVVKIK